MVAVPDVMAQELARGGWDQTVLAKPFVFVFCSECYSSSLKVLTRGLQGGLLGIAYLYLDVPITE
jgi:hypothetical protein